MITKDEVLKSIENLSVEEQINYVQEKFAEEKSKYNLYESILYGELLFEKYEVFGARYELPDLYNRAGEYNKTISFVTNWMTDPNSLEAIVINTLPLINLCEAYIYEKKYERALANLQLTLVALEESFKMFANNNELINILNFRVAYVNALYASVYYYQSKYSEAVEYLKVSFDRYVTTIACYYAAMIYEKSEEYKDYELAIEYFEKIADIEINNNTDFYSFFDEWNTVNANYELGIIYATVEGFIDRNKSYDYLKKAMNLGYDISEEEIKDIVDKISSEHTLNKIATNEGNGNKTSDGCYVATCVYGSYDCPEVWTLRRYRDYTLKENIFGRIFVRLYYSVSPTAVKLFGKYKWFHNLFKKPLDKFVVNLQEKGFKNTPYNDN